MIYLNVTNPFTFFKQKFADEAECALIVNYCFDTYIAGLQNKYVSSVPRSIISVFVKYSIYFF
jgi:hypothetical protein